MKTEEVKRYRALAAGARQKGWLAGGLTIEAAYYEEIAIQYDILADCMDMLARRRVH